MKRVSAILRDAQPHWVGDGFPVRSVLSHHQHGAAISPFLLLDYAPPFHFPPTDQPRGVERHPHRGFETVTIVYQGGLAHRDSAGHSGVIGPGDVQWMTAASGVLHEEFHEPGYAARGGIFQVAQLWVNLPARFKMSPPGYQTLLAADIPKVELADAGGVVHVIAGAFAGVRGPARTFTPVSVWNMRLRGGAAVTAAVPDGHMAGALIVAGRVRVGSSEVASEAEFVLWDRAGQDASVTALEESTVLFLAGEPIDEPVAARGPFVMNTADEIQQAIRDYQSGKMGQMD
ncbi:MAG: pirin family protein [Planctomycetia bacterium]|nr:MAG: pirin family protein [Planctomycetia bacterium]